MNEPLNLRPTPEDPNPTTAFSREPRLTIGHELQVEQGFLRASDLKNIGLVSYDPGFANTAGCRSAITRIDPELGQLDYRGYAIEELAERIGFTEVAYLLIHGELPNQAALDRWTATLAEEATVPNQTLAAIAALHPDVHPMTALQVAVASLGTDPTARSRQPTDLERHTRRLVAQMPTLVAAVHRHRRGERMPSPAPGLDFVEGFLAMCFGDRPAWRSSPVLKRAMEILLILHADHEQNCSTNVVRGAASAAADPYSAAAAGVGALSGPLHGGANEAVVRMLETIIGSHQPLDTFISEVKAKRVLLFGFGHAVYKAYDPRARLVKQLAHDVIGETGTDALLELALELERIALSDEYFISRHLYPNVDFYSGLIYRSLGFPIEMFTPIFAAARAAGWAAHLLEQETDPERKIMRPRQIYVGSPRRALPSHLDKPAVLESA